MIYKLLVHSWLSFWRSKTLNRSLATTIFTWFMMGLLMLYALGLGVMLPKIISKISPDKDSISVLNGVLIFYWMFELLFRIIFQRNVTVNIQYYLTQRISGYFLAHYMLLKSWANLFLLITVLLFAPFAFGTIVGSYGLATGWLWLGFLFAVSLFLHHLVIALHQLTKGRSLLPLVLGVCILLAAYVNFAGYADFTFITKGLMAVVLVNPLIILVPILLSVALYFYDSRFIVGNLYLDSLPSSTKVATEGISRWVSYLSSYGTVGQLMALELRLIWRNRRSRPIIIMSMFMEVYILYALITMSDVSVVAMFLLFATGAVMANYGQLLFSWESSYFDFLMTRNFSVKTYLTSKFILFFSFNSISLIVVGLILVLIDISLLYEVAIWYLINCGVFIYLIIGGTMMAPKPLDVNGPVMFNYEGMGVFQFLLVIPFMAIPLVVNLSLDYYLGNNWRILVLVLSGLSGIVLYKAILTNLAKGFSKRKYKILDGFRE